MVCSMPAKKMRVEVFDNNGDRYTITFDGKVTRKKALRLLDIVELLGGVHDEQESEREVIAVSKFAKTKSIVEEQFPFIWFSSREVLLLYEKEFNEPISLSTVSTYLARLVDRGCLVRRGSAYSRKYRMAPKLAQSNLKRVQLEDKGV